MTTHTLEPYKACTYGSHRWAVRNTATGARAELPVMVDHPEFGLMRTYRGFYRTRRDAQAAIDALQTSSQTHA